MTEPVDRLRLFATPVDVYQLDELAELNPQLTRRLSQEASSVASIERSNVGTWHSAPDLCQREESCYQRVVEAMLARVRSTFDQMLLERGEPLDQPFDYAVHGWAMVATDGGYVALHDHVEAHFSVAYYPDAGDADSERDPLSGLLAFVDPGHGRMSVAGREINPSTFTIRPRTGMLVIFPGWLQHYVHPYRGGRPRVSLSFNVRLEPAEA